MNRTEMKKEAVKRMELLRIIPQTIKEFEKEDKVNKSEYKGILYWIDEEEQAKIKEFEEEYNALVYHVIESSYRMCDGSIMKFTDYLYVSEHEDEWALDRDDIKNNIALVCTISDVCPYGEFGSIGIRPINGGVMRVA